MKRLLAVSALVLTAACQTSTPTPVADRPSSAQTPASPASEPTTAETAAPAAAAVPVAAALHGVPGPNRRLTPGEIFPSATRSIVCVSGYSASVRNVPDATRRAVFAAYGIAYPPASGAYELDHLISLELGGDNSARNLWPESYTGAGSAHVKDHLENKLHALVCSGQLSLKAAQVAIAGDWYAAAAKYGALTVSSVPRPATPPRAPVAPAAPVTVGNGATAMCRDGSYSYAAHHQGACSHHGGVAVFYR
jgi:hypothetical protein